MATRKRLLLLLFPLTLLASCAAPAQPGATPAGKTDSPAPTAAKTTEVSGSHPRAVISHDGGLSTVDLATGDTISTIPTEGLVRLNDSGDGRHVMVTEGDAFRVFDGGLQAESHGDHSHYYASEPAFTDVSYTAAKPGHAVAHGDHTALFGDGDGSIQIIESDAIAEPGAPVEKLAADAPHHGVAVRLSDGSVLHTQGTTEARTTVQVRAADKVIAETTDCPATHGEATAKPTAGGDVAVIGCANGAVVYRDGAFHKVAIEGSYGRSGTLSGSPTSTVVLADYKVDEAAEHEHPTQVALIDTTDASLRLVDLGASYWFRSLARGPHGEALVLTTDGAVQVIDPEMGTVTASIPAIGAWQENEDWHAPGPILKVSGERAYVTDAAADELVVIDLHDLDVVERHALGVTPFEIAIVTGQPDQPHHH